MKVLSRFGQPHGLDMRADEILVCKVEPWRCDRACNQLLRAAEVVLIVRRAVGAIGQDEGWLATSTSTPAALRVIGGRGRRVPEVDSVQVADIDTEFHGRRAVQDWKGSLAEGLLAFDP